MQITCWGSRGSIPVSGEEYNRYGGDTTCLEIRTKDGQIIIIDAGTGIRRLGNKLMSEHCHKYEMIFTHAHWDHLMGFPFFKPLYFSKTHINMQGCPFAQKFVESMLNKVMAPPNFPVGYSEITADISYTPACPEQLEIGNAIIRPIQLSHPNQGNGYKFIEEGHTFVFITDNELDYIHKGGLSFEAYKEFSTGADLLIHDGEFTEEEYRFTRKWGHSKFTTALELAIQADVRQFGLFHLNQERTDDAVDQIISKCRKIITEKGSGLECFAVGSNMQFEI